MFIDEDLLRDFEKDNFSEEEVLVIEKYDRRHTLCLILIVILIMVSFLCSNFVDGDMGYVSSTIVNTFIICLSIYSSCILWFLKRKLSKISSRR